MVKINTNFNKCPYCGAQNRPLSTYCSQCGRELSPHYKKVQTAKKIFKGSKIIIKSVVSKKYREKTIQKVMGKTYGFNMNQNMGNFSEKKSGDFGYLLCDKCPVYYKLDHQLGPEDSRVCGCGGNLVYSNKPRYED
ncbi:MAG: hypothetical protein CVV28_09815 [Methanobacteriales archaeon HGW-Methanobacteriales-1]|jgi:hypothetical protein|nr:MAG: hypothetical protein CVV28_09815 [Methanobacteriales archaeon HGW-Methanobacteriales-1]